MAMLFALHGAEFGAAYDSAVAALQTVLKALGTGIGDSTLKAIVVDGLIGPKTVAATNRALTVHIGPGQAGATLRTGVLSQAQVLAAIGSITNILNTEAARRGISVGAVKAPAKKSTSTSTAARATAVTIPLPATTSPPAVMPSTQVYSPPPGTPAPGGFDAKSIVKWAAVGLGVVVVAGVAYYMVARKKLALGETYDSDSRIYRADITIKGGAQIKGIRIVSDRKLTKTQLARKIADYYNYPGVQIDRYDSEIVT